MATKTARSTPKAPVAAPGFALSRAESVGAGLRSVIDSESGIVRGYKAASDPNLVAARKAVNAARTNAITAKLLADLAV